MGNHYFSNIKTWRMNRIKWKEKKTGKVRANDFKKRALDNTTYKGGGSMGGLHKRRRDCFIKIRWL